LPVLVEGKLERVLLWTQILTGMDLDNRGAVRVLGAGEWQDSRRRLADLDGSPQP
jgi:hypothetical protein